MQVALAKLIPLTAISHGHACWCEDALWLKQVRMKAAHGNELLWSVVRRLLSGVREKPLMDFSFFF